MANLSNSSPGFSAGYAISVCSRTVWARQKLLTQLAEYSEIFWISQCWGQRLTWTPPFPIFVAIPSVVLKHLHGSCCLNYMLCLMIGWERTLCRIYQFSGALKYTCIEKIKTKHLQQALEFFKDKWVHTNVRNINPKYHYNPPQKDPIPTALTNRDFCPLLNVDGQWWFLHRMRHWWKVMNCGSICRKVTTIRWSLSYHYHYIRLVIGTKSPFCHSDWLVG